MSLYKEILLDHYKNPRHRGTVANCLFNVEQANPLCGDVVNVSGRVVDEILVEVAFVGKGCVISQATASMLLEKHAGGLVVDILACTPQDVLHLVQMELGPNRIKCALLALMALQAGVKKC
jgi:nitrogen fixation NifU-like protein